MFKTSESEIEESVGAGGAVRALTVSQLTRLIQHTLEAEIGLISFTGEISECTRARSGHLYFTLSDGDSQISAVMWQGSTRSLAFEPDKGVEVICSGKPAVYARGGRLQMIVQRMTLAGDGNLQRQFQELKNKLEKEGLFSEDRKRAVPFMPAAVGIVTSKGGAAIHDIMTKIRERMPGQCVYLWDARVQGPGSAGEISAGIRRFNELGLVDVIIVGRGGGSLEDLWAFNEEELVRAIFASQIPVISAVGHEVDVTLSDLVADVRVPTPTAAGEFVVPARVDLLERIEDLEARLLDLESWFYPLAQELDDYSERLEEQVLLLVERSKMRVENLSARVQSIQPDRLLEALSAQIALLHQRLSDGTLRTIDGHRSKVSDLKSVLDYRSPATMLALFKERLRVACQRLNINCDRALTDQVNALESLAARLAAASPHAVLERGYSIVHRGAELVTAADQLCVGDEMSVQFSSGAVEAEVVKLKH